MISNNKNKSFIIAEAGINHNGNVSIAKLMIDIAVRAGADAVKFQTFWNINRLKQYELTKDEFRSLHEYCKDKKIMFMSTPHTFEAIQFLDELVSIYKIASAYLPNANFLREVADKNKPIFLSTGSLIHKNGMAADEEIANALSFIPEADVTLLHCVSKYPCSSPYYERILKLKNIFNIDVGLSDHSKNIDVPKVPYLEKHIMLHNVDSIDKNVSLYPEEFAIMVNNIRGE